MADASITAACTGALSFSFVAPSTSESEYCTVLGEDVSTLKIVYLFNIITVNMR